MLGRFLILVKRRAYPGGMGAADNPRGYVAFTVSLEQAKGGNLGSGQAISP
jgi:hypothetical protein